MGPIPEGWKLPSLRLGLAVTLSLFFSAARLQAQTTVTVDNNSGDPSTTGSLGWAVTTINAAGAGTVTFDNNVIQITLSQVLAPFSNTVTFIGNFPVIYGQNSAQAQLLFQQDFRQSDSFELHNNGGLSAGLDASVTAASWTMDPGVGFVLGGGPSTDINTTGGVGVTGQNGGNTSVTVGVWTLSSADDVALNPGVGGSVTDTGGSNDLGGAGGSASVTAASILLLGASAQHFILSAGNGGSVTDLGVGTNTGGAGGSASVASNFVSIGTASIFTLTGGFGGSGVTGGAGGGASLLAGSVSVASSFSVLGRTGGNGLAVGGSGGSAFVSFGTLTQSSPNQYIHVNGGNGGNSASASGNGGNATVEGGSVSLTSNSGFQVIGGSAGNFLFLTGETVNGGNGGNAGVSLLTFSDSSSATVLVAGGNGGSGSSGASAGNGGLGGNTSLSLGAFSLAGSSAIAFGGGVGGNGGDNTSGGTGGTGGIGGSLAVTLGSLTLGTGSSLTLSGSSGGNGGNATGGTGGAGGNGGNIFLTAGAVTLGAGDNLDLAGGAGGAGGTGTTGGSNGAQGQIAVSIGNLVNQGNVFLNGTNAILGVGSNFTQTSGSSLNLVLGGLGAVSSGLVTVGGTAQLGGTLALTANSGLTAPAIGQSVTVITAASVSGIFQNVGEVLPGMRFLNLYLPTVVKLESIIPSFEQTSATSNEKVIGKDLDSLVFKSATASLMGQLGVMSNASFQATEDQLSPAGLAALYQPVFERVSLQTDLADQRLALLRSGSEGKGGSRADSRFLGEGGFPLFASTLTPQAEKRMISSPQDQWNGSLSWNQRSFTISGDGNATGYQSTSGNLLTASLDKRVSKSLALGFQLGYGSSAIDLNGTGAVTETGGQAAAYGTWFTNGFYVNALAQAGFESYQSSRQAFGGTAAGTASGMELGGQLGLGYDFKSGTLSFGPLASVQFTAVNVPGFTETGSTAPLTLPAQSADSLSSRVGAQANGSFKIEDVTLKPQLSLAWEHEFDYQGGNIQAGFGQGDSFTVAGSAIGQEGILIGAGLSIGLSKNLSLSLDYQGELGRTNLTSQRFGGGVGLSI